MQDWTLIYYAAEPNECIMIMALSICLSTTLDLYRLENIEMIKQTQTGYISNRLKALAKELNIPVTVLSQLSREIEKRPIEQRMPNLSDLRHSGDIEQDADLIM